MAPQNLFSLIGERLMLNDQSITIPVYNVLFEVSLLPNKPRKKLVF